jgi:2-succinyl-5-enolpyruvyl-6-hydroxy-3-cyclohexene-1-carboxylate synthase
VIAIINNGGGRIFDRLPRVKSMSQSTQEIITNAHTFKFKDWATMWGMEHHLYTSADTIEIESPEKCAVLEFVPCSKQTEAFWTDFAALDL